MSSDLRYKIPHAELKVSAIILAAGSSSRLGRPKQLVKYQGKSLVTHAIEQALSTSFQSVFVVLGAKSDLIRQEIGSFSVNIFLNERWEEGIGTSISEGIKYFQMVHPDSDGVVLMTCDQPFVTSELLESLLEKRQKTAKHLVASQYANSIGIPAFFSSSLFDELSRLNGNKGAKKVILKYPEETALINFPRGDFDVDTEEDVERLNNLNDK